MSVPLRWIKQQVARAELDLEEAQRRLATWKEALRLAEEVEDVTPAARQPVDTAIQEPKPRRRAGKIIDRVEEILREHGPAKAAEIQKRLEQIGIRTTANSINTSLNRFRPTRFDRDVHGKWLIVEGVEHRRQSSQSSNF